MTSVKRRKITSLPLKVKRQIPGQKSQIVKCELMAATFDSIEHQEFDHCETRTGEAIMINEELQLANELLEQKDVTEGSEYSKRQDRNFTTWSDMLKKSLTISCEI